MSGRGGAPVCLALRALALGDLLVAVPALRALARALPGHRLVVAAPGGLAPVLRLVEGVTGMVPARPLEPLPAGLPRPDLAVNLHGEGPESHRVLLATRPWELWAFANPQVPESAGGPPFPHCVHEAERWCRLLRAHGVPCDPGERALRAPAGDVPRGVRGATVVHPGAGRPSRRWPPGRWAEVARAEAAAGRRVVVTGSPDERPLAQRVAALAGLPRAAVLAGRTDLLGLVRVVAAAGRVASADTGVAHLAVALGRPSLTLYGPVGPAEWGPPPGRPRHRVLWAGRRGDPFAGAPDAGLLSIGVGSVVAALDDLPAAE